MILAPDTEQKRIFDEHIAAGLEPGDVILTGTPMGVGPLVDGDEVTVEIDGIGTLRNMCRRI